jgi:hypothetical protein
MESAYDGRQVVGMDVHRRRSLLVRMTKDGRRLGTARISNSQAELRKEIARASKSPRVVIEATYGWYWAADTLAAAGAQVHLAHPLGVKAFTYRRVRNDQRDAADLADLLRMGRLPEAWPRLHSGAGFAGRAGRHGGKPRRWGGRRPSGKRGRKPSGGPGNRPGGQGV